MREQFKMKMMLNKRDEGNSNECQLSNLVLARAIGQFVQLKTSAKKLAA